MNPNKPLPGDTMCEKDSQVAWLCCTPEHIKATYDLPVYVGYSYVYGIRPDITNPHAVSWNYWVDSYEFGKIVRAKCNRTYSHGDKLDGKTLLSRDKLQNELDTIGWTKFVYIKDNAFHAFTQADPRISDTVVTESGKAYLCIGLSELQVTYGLNLNGVYNPNMAYGIRPVADLVGMPVSWVGWDLSKPSDGPYAITEVTPAYTNQRDYENGDDVCIDTIHYTLLCRQSMLDELHLSDCSDLVSFSNGKLVHHTGLIKA